MSDRHLPPLPPNELEALRKYIEERGRPEQRAAITSEDLLTVVSAGAGTGKTWTLAWRFVWTVLTRTDVRRVLTLTFTEKAASEMRVRIAGLLCELKQKLALGTMPVLSKRLDESLSLLDQAYISTIHGFSTRVIAEAGLALPIEPSVCLVSDPETEEFWRELTSAFDRLDAAWFCRGLSAQSAQFAREILESAETADVLNTWGPQSVSAFGKEFEEMMADCGETPESILNKDSAAAEAARSVLRALLDREFAKLAVMWTNALSLSDSEIGTTQLAERYTALRSRWGGQDIMETAREFVFDAADAVKGARGKLADVLAECVGMKLSEWRLAAESLRAFVRPAYDGWSEDERRLRSALLRLAWLCWVKWSAWKDARGCITFSDMIALASQALGVNEAYASRFCEVLVDEFQDTNDQQDALIRKIRAVSGARLFIVGDLKQSIYRFRHAEPSLFERYIAEAKSGGCYVALFVSFRSGEGVLDAVNERFSVMWKERLGEGLRQPYEKLCSPRGTDPEPAWIDARQKTGMPVCQRILEQPQKVAEKKFERLGETRARLALRLVGKIVSLHENGASVWDKSNSLRPMKWGDVAVLVPTRSSYPALRAAFERWGVPAAFVGNQSFYSRTEIRDIGALAGFLASPDAVSLAGFLCSPFSGLTQDDAQSLLPQLTQSSPIEAVRARFPSLAAKLERWRLTAMMKGSSSVLSEVLADGTLLSGVHPVKRAGVVANLRRAVSILTDCEQSLGTSPAASAVYFQNALDQSRANPEASAGEDEDTVKVMTIHASKGLEFPLVAVFGIEHGGRSRGGESLSVSRRLMAAAPRLPDSWGDGECLLGSVNRKIEEQEEYEELQRLYYVAMTRARDGLILCGVAPQEADGKERSAPNRSMMSIEYAAGGDFSLCSDDVQPVCVSRSAQKAFDGKTVKQTPRRRALRDISATSHSLWMQCPAAWRMVFRQNLSLGWSAPEEGAGGAGGAELGTVAHWILSKWNFTDEGYQRILSLQEGHLRPEFRRIWRDERARHELASFGSSFHSEQGERLRARLLAAANAGTLRREYPFRAALGNVSLVGAVDVFWIEHDETGNPVRLCVRDYKTTRAALNPLRQRWLDEFYTRQLRFYALALALQNPELAGLETDLGIWYLRSGSEHVLRTFTPQDADELTRSLSEQAHAAANGPWESCHAKCAGCPYERGCLFASQPAKE